MISQISQIIIGICCFFVGNIVGIILVSVFQTGEIPDDVQQHCDTCDKCLGVLFDECKTCPKKEGKLDADKV